MCHGRLWRAKERGLSLASQRREQSNGAAHVAKQPDYASWFFSRFVTELLVKGGEGVSSKCQRSVKTLKTAASDNRHFQWKAARTQMAGWLVGLYDEYNQDFSKQAETLRDNVCVAGSPTFQQTSIMVGES